MTKTKLAMIRLTQFVILCAAALLLASCASNRPAWAADPSFTFVQLCDPQLGFTDYEKDKASLRQAVAQINQLKPDFVIVCGDMVNTAKPETFADFKEIMSGLKMHYYCAPGNHDVGTPPTAKSLQDYRHAFGPDHVMRNHKYAAFLFLNTQLIKESVTAESAKQDTWLRESLDEALKKDKKVFVVAHHPLFIKNPNEPEEYMNLPIAERARLLGLFSRHNVVAVLGGHAHKLIVNNYENILLVNGESTSKNLDDSPLGFRLWHVDASGTPSHEFIQLEMKAPDN